VIARVLAGGERPRAIAIANQGETCAVWDARTGGPLGHALVWQDLRTQPEVARLAGDPALAALVHDVTGLRLDPYFSAPKLRWLLERAPARTALRAGTVDAWLIERLTGGAVFATDVSTAARTLLCDTRTGAWSPALCAAFGVPGDVLPEIRASDAGFGTCTLPGLDGVPIVASLVDQPAALLGHGCVDRGDVKATFGTGCFVYANTGTARPEATRTLATIAWQRTGEPICYALDGGVLAVGTAFGWLRELGLPLAATPTEVVCVPALVGLGAPHWDRDARAAWLGMSSATTRDELAGAVLEGVACRIVEVVRAVEADAGIAVGELRADGGLTHVPALVQRVADLLGAPVAIAEHAEATVLGACALAQLALGDLTLADLRDRRARVSSRVAPGISPDERGQRLDRFARAVALVRQWR
jgi:glycerol kinase